jgi:hypothetical protein
LLTVQDFLLLGDNGLAVRRRLGDEIDQLSAQPTNGMALLPGAFAELLQPGTEFLDLFISDADLYGWDTCRPAACG